MMNKLNYLIGISLKRKMKTKWFIVANAIIAIVIVAGINIDSVINFFGGDFNKKQNIHIVDNTDRSHSIFEEQLIIIDKNIHGEESESYKFHLIENTTVEEAKKIIEENPKDFLLIFDNEESAVLKATLISEGYIDTVEFQKITTAINNTKTIVALNETNIPPTELAKLNAPVEIERIFLEEGKNSEAEMQATIMATVFPVIILPFFMLTIFLVQMIGAEVNDEKTTRGMEIIISNVSPTVHFSAKVIAGNIFVITQGILLFLFGIIGLLVRKIIGGGNIENGFGEEIVSMIKEILASDIGSQLIYIIPLTLILMLLTFIAYSLLAGILASMTTNIEDFQQLQTPIMIISLIGYYLAMMAGLFKGAMFIKIVSFIPLISAILSPSLLILNQIGVIEVIISILIMIAFNWLLIKYGLRIYKVGILNYSASDLWKKMFKALKN